MKRILILYFSGVGATKKVAELMNKKLSQNCDVNIFSVESNESPIIEDYDAIIIGTPVYHGAPAKVIMRYFKAQKRIDKEKPTFVFNTRGSHSLNTNRILSKLLYTKNIITIIDREYRSPASDGSIITPFIKRFFEFEKDLEMKIDHDCMAFLKLLKKDTPQGYIPRFRFGSIINAPNKLAGQYITLKIRLHKDKCSKCGKCIERCPHSVFSRDKVGYPMYTSKNCENCYRCVHHCPNIALSLSKRRTLKNLLRY